MSSLTGHCMNTVVFAGDNEQAILDHFNKMEEHTPPFLSIMVYDNALHFDSGWIPPTRSLSEIAEQFDVSYKIDFRVPYEDCGTCTYFTAAAIIVPGRPASCIYKCCRKSGTTCRKGNLSHTSYPCSKLRPARTRSFILSYW
jgi:hypothetical protein